MAKEKEQQDDVISEEIVSEAAPLPPETPPPPPEIPHGFLPTDMPGGPFDPNWQPPGQERDPEEQRKINEKMWLESKNLSRSFTLFSESSFPENKRINLALACWDQVSDTLSKNDREALEFIAVLASKDREQITDDEVQRLNNLSEFVSPGGSYSPIGGFVMEMRAVLIEGSPNVVFAGSASRLASWRRGEQAANRIDQDVEDYEQLYSRAHNAASEAEMESQNPLVRDIFGDSKTNNPFSKEKIKVDPSWLIWNDGTVRKIAEVIYQEKNFGDMPILADALEDAGCDNEEVLRHCRQGGEHVRGCWVLDLLLGKE